MIITKTPYRISFFGGGTDFPVWYEKNKSQVISTTINKYSYISLRHLPSFFDHKHRITYSIVEHVKDNNEINFALVPDLPESLEPIVEKANTFDNLSQSSDIKKSDLINNSSAIASIEFDEKVTTVATLKMLNPTWLQLRDKENNIVLSKLMDKDEEFSYELKLNYNITAGNAGNILVLIDDEVRGKIGKYGDILDSFVLYKDFTN